jgi:chaperonin GroES
MLNKSGIEPLDLRVLVLPDPVEEVTKGGIILSASIVEKDKFATVKGTIVAVGVNAFLEAKGNPAFVAPEPGDRVMIAKYEGVNITGKDGADYRLMNDTAVVALLEDHL